MQVNHGPEFLKKLLYLNGALSLVAFATSTTSWTLPIVFFGIYAIGENERKDASALVPFIGFHIFGMLLDLIVVGNVAQYLVFGTVITIFNLILKIFIAYVWHQYRTNYASGAGDMNAFMDNEHQQAGDAKGDNPPAPYANATSVPAPDYSDL